MDEKEKEFKRKVLGVVDTEKEMQLMQGPFRPGSAILTTPFSEPDVIKSFCTRCGDYGLITARGVALLEMLLEMYGREDEILENIDGYFIELEICPVCNPENEKMLFRFRKISEVED